MAVLSWWRHLSGSCRLCVRSERERKRKRENENENEKTEKRMIMKMKIMKKTDSRKNNHTQEITKLA